MMKSEIIKDPVRFTLSNTAFFASSRDDADLLRSLIAGYNSTCWHEGLRVVYIGSFGMSCELPREKFKELFKLTEERVVEMQERGFAGALDFGDHMGQHFNHMEVYPPITYLS